MHAQESRRKKKTMCVCNEACAVRRVWLPSWCQQSCTGHAFLQWSSAFNEHQNQLPEIRKFHWFLSCLLAQWSWWGLWISTVVDSSSSHWTFPHVMWVLECSPGGSILVWSLLGISSLLQDYHLTSPDYHQTFASLVPSRQTWHHTCQSTRPAAF